MESMEELEKANLQQMQQKIAELRNQKYIQNARIVEFMGVPHIHIDLKNGDIQTIDRNGITRTTPIKVTHQYTKESSGINYRNQPRDRRGRWTKILDGIKSVSKKVKKFKRNLSPNYHLRRVHRTRRQYQRQELYQQYQLLVPAKPKRRRRKTR